MKVWTAANMGNGSFQTLGTEGNALQGTPPASPATNPKFICWNPDLQCDGLKRRALWEVIRFR